MDLPPELKPESIRDWCNLEYVGRTEEGTIAGYRQTVMEWLLKNLPKSGISSILDVGTGEGVILNKVAEFTGAKDCLGIDISDVQIARCKERWAKKTYGFERADFLEIDLKHKYDLVICWSVLLHIPDTQIKQFAEKLIASSSKYIFLFHAHPNRPDVPDRMEWYHDHDALFGHLKIVAQLDTEQNGPNFIFRIYEVPKEEPESIEEEKEAAVVVG